METILVTAAVTSIVLGLAYIMWPAKKQEEKKMTLTEALKETDVRDFSTGVVERERNNFCIPPSYYRSAMSRFYQEMVPMWKGEELATRKALRNTVKDIEEDSKAANEAYKVLNEKIHLLAQAAGYEFKEDKREVKDTPAHFAPVKSSKKRTKKRK